LRRAFGSATSVAELVLIAGGTADDAALAHETYEVFDARTGRFDRDRSQKLQTGPRMQHAALALAEGQVLIVGGVPRAGDAPLGTAELVDVQNGRTQALSGAQAPQIARSFPSLLPFGSGDALLLGGRDGSGAFVSEVERYDASSQRFVIAADVVGNEGNEGNDGGDALRLPEHAEWQAAALPQGRIAYLGCDTAEGAAGCELLLLWAMGDGDGVMAVASSIDFASLAPNGLADVRMLATSDARLLVTGRDPLAPVARRAFMIDPDLSSVTQLEASRVPSQLLSLQDGSIVELDAFGASLRRESFVSRYSIEDAELLDETLAFVALDAAERFERKGKALEAREEGARVDVVPLRFGNVRVQLASTDHATLRLRFEDGSETQISRDGSSVRSGACRAELPKAQALRVTRRASKVELAGEGKPVCSLSVPEAELSLSLTLAEGASITSLSVRRLP
jgi:hypothetical protein